MLDHEKIFKQILNEEWANILTILHRNKKEIATESLLAHAANTFENAFLSKVGDYPLDDEVNKENLITFWQLHHGRFYTISESNYKKLIRELVRRLPYHDARNYAILLPNDQECQELLDQKKSTEPILNSKIDSGIDSGQIKTKIYSQKMAQYDTEIRETFDKKYVKVFLRDLKRLQEIQIVLNKLPSVSRVNITQNKEDDLTVYPRKLFSAEEVEEEVKQTLDVIFKSKAADPIVKEDVLSDGISTNVYRRILELIYHFGKNLEKFTSLRAAFDEEGYREYFLPYLNSMSESHTATGETFNKNGKTDILIQNTKGENVFIAECKVWTGEAAVISAVDQLLQRYVNWRDEKLALIIFNKTVKGFSDIIDKAIDTIKTHPLCNKYNGKTKDSCASFIFKHPDDDKKEVEIELMMFNCT